jgi:hypothetical protein
MILHARPTDETRNWPRPKPQPRSRPTRGADRGGQRDAVLFDLERLGQGCCPTVAIKSRYKKFTGPCRSLICVAARVLIVWRSWRLSHNPTFEAIAPSSGMDGAIVVSTAQLAVSQTYGTNLTPAVAPRLQTNSQFLAGMPSKENVSRNCFGRGIGSCKDTVAPFIEMFKTLQWREPAPV